MQRDDHSSENECGGGLLIGMGGTGTGNGVWQQARRRCPWTIVAVRICANNWITNIRDLYLVDQFWLVGGILIRHDSAGVHKFLLVARLRARLTVSERESAREPCQKMPPFYVPCPNSCYPLEIFKSVVTLFIQHTSESSPLIIMSSSQSYLVTFSTHKESSPAGKSPNIHFSCPPHVFRHPQQFLQK